MQYASQMLRQLAGRRRELASAVLIAGSLFLILAGYYLLKTVREALILTQGGAEVKSYASAGQAVILLLALPVFGWMANRIKGARLVSAVYLFFAANLGVFYLLTRAGANVAIPFYLWLGVFSVVSVALFWGYSNDIYTEAQGRTLFPYIGIGASLGGFLGAGLAKEMASSFEAHTLMLVGAVLVTASAAILILARQYVTQGPRVVKPQDPRKQAMGGFELIASSKYLMLIAGVVVLANVVNSTGEFIVGKAVVEASKTHAAAFQKQFITGFYADYYMLTGLAGILIQMLAVAPIFKRWGAGGALLILPVVALGGYTAMALTPMMWVIRAAKITENSLEYSLQNTARHALFLPTSEAAKYKAKATIDSFFHRFGDLLQAGLVLLGTALSFSATDYARLNIFAAVVWLAVAAAAAREYRRRTAPQATLSQSQASMRAAA